MQGVAVLFSKTFLPQSCEYKKMVKGRLLKVTAKFENVYLVFVCVYAAVALRESCAFLEKLSQTSAACDTDHHLVLG